MRAKRTIVLTLTAGLLLAPLATGADAAIRPVERRMARIINRARAANGLPRLQLAARPSRQARRHSRDVAQAFSLFHSCTICRYGENVGMNENVRAMHRGFMNSPAHRANILSPRYDRMGIGIVRDGNWIWVTEMFLL